MQPSELAFGLSYHLHWHGHLLLKEAVPSNGKKTEINFKEGPFRSNVLRLHMYIQVINPDAVQGVVQGVISLLKLH